MQYNIYIKETSCHIMFKTRSRNKVYLRYDLLYNLNIVRVLNYNILVVTYIIDIVYINYI